MIDRPVRTEPVDDGTLRILAPSVGAVLGLPEVGDVVVPGRPLGVVETLGRRERLMAPAGLAGRVVARLLPPTTRESGASPAS